MTRRVDEKWREIQLKTFQNWLNSSMKGHLKSSRMEVQSIATDLKDGLVIAQLLDNLSRNIKSGKRCTPCHRNPVLAVQMRENLTECFKFMKAENIKLVNIGPGDITDGNTKLILGLLWTLICHYQIRSTGRGLSTKQAMLSWVNAQIPEANVSNFTTNWNDGRALRALLDHIKPGLCPHHATLSPSQGLENCQLGMQIAKESLSIPLIMEPEHLSNPDVDELSVMTHLSYFCKLSIEKLQEWVNSKLAPNHKVSNFKRDWNNGIALAALIDAVSPGLFPEWDNLDPHHALENLTQAMKISEDHLSVRPLIKPSEMADPNVDELNVVTYISRFQYAKAVPQPKRCRVTGAGIHKAFVGKPAHFQVNTTQGGIGKLDVHISTSSGDAVTPEMMETSSGIYDVFYVPKSAEKLQISIQWGDQDVPKTPFTVSVIDTGSFEFTGQYITGAKCAKVGKSVCMTAKGEFVVSELQVVVQHENGQSEIAKVTPKSSSEANCVYTPVRVGMDKIVVTIAGEEIPGSPFQTQVVDPATCSVTAKIPPTGVPLVVGKQATFHISSTGTSSYGIIAEAKSPSSTLTEMQCSLRKGGPMIAMYTPSEVGSHTVIVTCGGDNIRGSPLSLLVIDPTKCTFLDVIPKQLEGQKKTKVNISTKNAGPGKLEATSSNAAVVSPTIKQVSTDLYSLELGALTLGQADISVTWSRSPIPLAPFNVTVCYASKCSAYGQGLSSGVGKIEEPFEFIVQAKKAGPGELDVKPQGPNSTYAADITDNSDGTFVVSFTSFETGLHSIVVTWGGVPIPGSPFSVRFVKGADSNLFTATGEGLASLVAKERTSFMLLGPEQGLLDNGVLEVLISGDDFSSQSVSSIAPVIEGDSIQVCTRDNRNGTYRVEYAVPESGHYSINISCSEIPIPGSPFSVHALPAASAESCRVFGPAIDHAQNLVKGCTLEFNVDSTSAGTGSLSVAATDPTSRSIPAYIAEETGDHNQRIHVIKIDPQTQGRYTVEVKWSGTHIHGSPFEFNIGDPGKCEIISLPSKESFVAKVGQPVIVVVNTSRAGPGELKALAKLNNGTVQPFEMQHDKGGVFTCAYTPKDAGRMELLLTFGGVTILQETWAVDIANPSLFQVTAPKEFGRQHEYVKFVISGLTKSTKSLSFRVSHEQHDATVTVDKEDKTTAIGRFIAKMTGCYKVEVLCAGQHISGSPFTVYVANPDSCKIEGEVPRVVAMRHPVTVSLLTKECGPGDLSFALEQGSQEDPCIVCSIDDTSRGAQKIVLEPKRVGICKLFLKWADYIIPGMPVLLSVVDPMKCSFSCPQLTNKDSVTQNEKMHVNINISLSGQCTPELVASGPRANYATGLVISDDGTYIGSFTPWQTGQHSIRVMVGGVEVPNSPLRFEVIKLIDPSRITASGSALSEALALLPNTVTIFASEPKLLLRGALTFELARLEGESSMRPDIQCKDNDNGAYTLSYTPYDTGAHSLSILYEMQPIANSPFVIEVHSPPQAAECTASGRILEPGVTLKVKDSAEFTVDTSKAGSGSLTVTGKQPDGSSLRVFSTKDEEEGEHFIKFDAPKVGTYVVNVKWDAHDIPGSPFKINVVDHQRCWIADDIPTILQIKQTKVIVIDCTGAGMASLEVLLNNSETNPSLTAEVEEITDIDDSGFVKYRISFAGTEIGEVAVDLLWGGFSVPQSPFGISVSDATKVAVDADDMLQQTLQVGLPFRFRVLSSNAGYVKLHVKPAKDSEAQYTIDITSESEGEHLVTVTPWTAGRQGLDILWGETSIPKTPLAFSVSDPKKCRVIGLPDSANYTAIVGESLLFSVDIADAGPGELTAIAKCSNDSEEPIRIKADEEDEEGLLQLSYIPSMPGRLELDIRYNGVPILAAPWVCEVPDPTQFRVTAPKGFGKKSEPVRFAITGVTTQTQNFSITASHPDHTASITTEHGKDEKTFIGFFTPEETGEYLVQVQHASTDIDGSPFTILVADPSACVVESDLKQSDTYVINEDHKIIISATAAGPGQLSAHFVCLSGDLTVTPHCSQTEDDKEEVTFSSSDVGVCNFVFRWADHTIFPDPFTANFIDPSKVTCTCLQLESGEIIKQGKALVFDISCTEAGLCSPVVEVAGPNSAYTMDNTDNKDGTHTAKVIPWQTGEYTVHILLGGHDIPNSPFEFEVLQVIDPRSISAMGDGLSFSVAREPSQFIINSPRAGLMEDGLLVIQCFDAEDESIIPEMDVEDNEDGTFTIQAVYPQEGTYILHIDYEEQPIYRSPFTVLVKEAPSADKCILSGPSYKKAIRKVSLVLGQAVEFTVDTTDAGNGRLTTSTTDPTGEPVRIFTSEEEVDGRQLHHLKFDPYEVGVYRTKLYWSNEPLPGTPLVFSVIDPSRCKLEGLPLPNGGVVQLGEMVSFSVNPGDAGSILTSVLLTSRGDSHDVVATLHPASTESQPDLNMYSFLTEEPGNCDIVVKICSTQIPHSPFKCDIVDPDEFAIYDLNVQGKYALVCELVSFKIRGDLPEGERYSVIAHGPMADLNCDVRKSEDGDYRSSFVPIEPGSYEVFVECAGKHLPGSPFSVSVADPSKCLLLGDFPTMMQVGQKEELIVKTRGTGMGKLDVLIRMENSQGTDENEGASFVQCSVEDQGLDTYRIVFEPLLVGDIQVYVHWAGFNIPSSPVKANICDASLCKVFGQALLSKAANVGEPVIFTVVTHKAGNGQLVVKALGPSAQYSVIVKDTGDRKYEAQFTPWEVGGHKVDVMWGNGHLTDSPFLLNISGSLAGTVPCNVTGEGLKRAIAGWPMTFTIISNEIGLLERGAIRVAVTGVQAHAEVLVKDLNNGCYTVQYIAPSPGAYIATILLNDKPAPGSPFEINCVPGPDASKCRAYGPALHPNSLHISGSLLEFKVDSSEAGSGNLRVYIQGPHDYHPKVYIANDVQGIHLVKFDAMKAGWYIVVVAWADNHILGSPFKIKVHPAADTSQVKAYGPGLENGILGDSDQFTIETKNAGTGTLLIRIHGIKDAFKIEAVPVVEDDPRTLLVKYSPKMAGEYVIFVRWSGNHIPGSPFTVRIAKHSGETSSSDEIEEQGANVFVSTSSAPLPAKAESKKKHRWRAKAQTSTDEESDKKKLRIPTRKISAKDRSYGQKAPNYDDGSKKKKRVPRSRSQSQGVHQGLSMIIAIPRSQSGGELKGPLGPHNDMVMKRNLSFRGIPPSGDPVMMQPVMRTKKIVYEKKVVRKWHSVETSPSGATPLPTTVERDAKEKKDKKIRRKSSVEDTDTATAPEKKPKRKRSWWQHFQLS